ncbi:Prolyl 4-hydroxylase subunit alpha-1 [Lamellibrachia satsuma]|nr:Prolyl 4-hydroxylase subunit alpha-1 [Lamellibrachia satsuma]
MRCYSVCQIVSYAVWKWCSRSAARLVLQIRRESNDDDIEQLMWGARRQFNSWLGENKDVVFNATTWPRPELTNTVTRNYEALCRGDTGNDRYTDPTARCRYKAGSIGYVRYKEEILRDVPGIVMFYDVISDAESLAVREMARHQLERATVGNPSDGFTSNTRISKITWLNDSNSSLLLKLSKRIEDITGLDTTLRTRLSSTELFQVLNYGIGGQYEPHFDFYEDRIQLEKYPVELKGSGERLATFLFYLTDVQFGGATVFPNAGVRVKVVKNGAAFWYNLKSSGDLDRRTLHAGCPVLLGSKWVTNKWIHEYGQQFRRPCGLRRNAPAPTP